MASTVRHRPDDIRSDVDRFCAGSKPPTNGLEERLDMLVAQLAVIAYELHELNKVMRDGRTD